MPRSGIAGLYDGFIPCFLRNLHTSSILAVSIYISTNSARVFPFLHTLSSIYCCRLFDDGHSDRCVGSKICADGDCSHEIKRHFLLRRKAMHNLDSILKSRDITLPTKARLIKTMVFPVVIYGCESCTIKKAECQRIDDFEL